MIDLVPERRDLPLFDATDTPWIATVVDQVVDCRGEPWRVLRERLEHSPIRANRVAAILGALRRVLGGRAERARIARRVRSLVLGHPALEGTTRSERLAAASAELGIAVEEVDGLMWIDLANERPVTLPEGRPDERRLAAFANLDRIQRAVRRARTLRLTVWEHAHELIRTAKRYGLLVAVRSEGAATILDVLGPLSLFHATGVYGTALAALVPLLADHARFELAIDCDFGYGSTALRVAPPVLLPPVVTRGSPSLTARLVRELGKTAPDLPVERDPPPLVRGRDLLFPDLAIDHRGTRTYVELIGFATQAFVASHLERYAAAGITNVLLCIDDKRASEDLGLIETRLLRFSGRLTAAALLSRLSELR
ncbi:MAG: hypothetical protein JWP01_764 [Myxococcales bacterium]|nr:hypothetical protein [Myxococcales bacterium]